MTINPNYRKYIIRTRYEEELKCWVAYREINPTTQITGNSKDEAVVNFIKHNLYLDKVLRES